nr:HprK-related kinase A [Motiliproteus sp. SC1-56]
MLVKRHAPRNAHHFLVGPFKVAISTSERHLIQTVQAFEQCYPPGNPRDFTDFHLEYKRPLSTRRYLAPQINFFFDGQQPFKPLPAREAYPFFEWSLNWCIATNAHQYLMLHAAVLAAPSGGLIMPAAPGSGKSTLAAALGFSGWDLFSDEFALIDRQDGLLHPLIRPLSLKNASIELITRSFSDACIESCVSNTNKGTVAHLHPPRAGTEAPGPIAPKWLVFPKYQPGSKLTLTPLTPDEALIRCINESFNFNALGATGFEALTRLITHCESYTLVYSKLDDALNLFSTKFYSP